MNYYSTDSTPLKQMAEKDIPAGFELYNELGQYVKKVYQRDDSIYFVELIDSVLKEGEVLSELTPLQLELFWALSRTKRNKYNELKDNNRN